MTVSLWLSTLFHKTATHNVRVLLHLIPLDIMQQHHCQCAPSPCPTRHQAATSLCQCAPSSCSMRHRAATSLCQCAPSSCSIRHHAAMSLCQCAPVPSSTGHAPTSLCQCAPAPYSTRHAAKSQCQCTPSSCSIGHHAATSLCQCGAPYCSRDAPDRQQHHCVSVLQYPVPLNIMQQHHCQCRASYCTRHAATSLFQCATVTDHMLCNLCMTTCCVTSE